ncbi:MAG TPA: response regulator [Labilithrix sp.]
MSNGPPKRPTIPPPVSQPGAKTPSRPPPGSIVPGRASARPGNVRDAMAEAQAIAGGGLPRPSTAPNAFTTGGRKSILLVDDDATMRQRLRAALEPYYDVHEAKDGMEAVELAGKIPTPSMVVSDVIMPRVDGFTLAKIFRGNPTLKKVPIMFVSSKNSPQDVTQALVLGACQYVPKSTPISEIVAKIRKIVV